MIALLLVLVVACVAGAFGLGWLAGRDAGVRSIAAPLRELADGWAGSGPALAAAVRELLDRK